MEFVLRVIRGFLGGDEVVKNKVSDLISSKEWMILHLGGQLKIKELEEKTKKKVSDENDLCDRK